MDAASALDEPASDSSLQRFTQLRKSLFSLLFFLIKLFILYWGMADNGLPGGSAGKESACSAGDLGLIPGLGISPGDREGYPLQFSGLENSMD